MIYVEWKPSGPVVHEGGNSYLPDRVVLHMVAGNSGPVAEWRDHAGRSRSTSVLIGHPPAVVTASSIPVESVEGLARRR